MQWICILRKRKHLTTCNLLLAGASEVSLRYRNHSSRNVFISKTNDNFVKYLILQKTGAKRISVFILFIVIYITIIGIYIKVLIFNWKLTLFVKIS